MPGKEGVRRGPGADQATVKGDRREGTRTMGAGRRGLKV